MIDASEREFNALQGEAEALEHLLNRFWGEGCPREDVEGLDALESEFEARRDAYFAAAA